MDNCKDAVCIQTNQVYDSCRDKECLENLRVYLTERGQCLVDKAINVKCRSAEIIWVFSDVEPVQFNKGFYSVDIKFFFKVTLDVFTNIGQPTRVAGLATYDKKVVLFGSEGNAKIFTSKFKEGEFDPQMWQKSNLPKSVIEVVDPICLNARLVENHDGCCCDHEIDFANVPDSIQKIFDDGLVLSGEQKRVLVTIGLFTIVKLERDTQLLIPAFDFCIPDKECVASTEKNPCDLFEKLNFPVDEFFPPIKRDSKKDDISCGCD